MNRVCFLTNINSSVTSACSRSAVRRQKSCSCRLRQQFSVREGQQRPTKPTVGAGSNISATTVVPPPTGSHVRFSYRASSTSPSSSAATPRKTISGGRLASGPGLRDFLVEMPGRASDGSDGVGVQGGEMSFPIATWSKGEDLEGVAAKDMDSRTRAVGDNNNGDGKSARCQKNTVYNTPRLVRLSVEPRFFPPRLWRLQCRNLPRYEVLDSVSPSLAM